MKRFLSLMLCVMMCISSVIYSPAYAAGDVGTSGEATVAQLAISSKTTRPGDSVTLTLTLSSAPMLKSIALTGFAYDRDALELTEGKWQLSDSILSSWDADKQTAAIAFADNKDVNGEIFTLTFKAKDNLEDGVYTIGCAITAKTKLASGVEESVVISVVSGAIEVINVIRGDVNGDDLVTSDDAIYVLYYTLLPDMYPVNQTVDFNEDGLETSDDAIYLLYYTLLPDLYPLAAKCVHSLRAVEATPATCTEDGNSAYWTCIKCGKLFADANGKAQTTLADTVISATGHTYAEAWSCDANYHWHPAACAHSAEVSDKAEHTLDDNLICTVCAYNAKANYKLATPVITSVEYDTVYWDPVENAKNYTVIVNDNYSRTVLGTSCPLNEVFWDGKPISKCGIVRITVRANGHDGYTDSDLAATHTTYFYVPETPVTAESTPATAFSFGHGYNLVEDPYLRVKEYASKNSVLNLNKLLTLGKFQKSQGTAYIGYGYYFETIDDFLSKSALSIDLGSEVGCALIGSVKTQLGIDASVDYRTHHYNCTYVGKHGIDFYDYAISDLEDDKLVYCLSDNFQKEIKRQTVATSNMTDMELAAYLYEKYGTHVILGVKTGGEYTATYTVQTDDEKIAAAVKIAFEISTGGQAIDQIIAKNFNFGIELSEEIECNTSKTHTSFITSYYGGNGQITTSMTDYSSTKGTWGVDASNASSIGFTKDGAVAISSLIRSINPSLANALEDYINEQADAEYAALYAQYTIPSSLPMTVNHVDGENVLLIDLSAYQASGSLENAYSPALRNGVLSVSPVMLGKRIDKIVVNGAFATGNESANTLINPFSISLTKEWKKNVDIEFKNLGVVSASEYGLVDKSNTHGISVNTLYSGINFVEMADGSKELFVSTDKNTYCMAFDLSDGETLDVSTVYIDGSETVLPVAEKAGYSFAGWYDSDNTRVADHLGALDDNYMPSAQVVLHPAWTRLTYEITLNNQGALQHGSEAFYERYEDCFVDDYADNANKLTSIAIPEKTGYTFGGYFASVSDNSTSVASGEDMIINAEGEICVGTDYFTANAQIYALWTPVQYKVIIFSDNVEVARYIQTYGVGVFNGDGYAIESIDLPEKVGYTFVGFDPEGFVDTDGKILAAKNKDYKQVTEDKRLDVVWSANTYTVTLDANGGSVSPTTKDVTYDSVYGDLPIPTLAGYDFTRWLLSGNGIAAETIVKTAQDHTIIAEWAVKSYIATWLNPDNASIAVKRTASPLKNADTGALNSGATVYHGDVLEITYTPDAGYVIKSNGETSITVEKAVTTADIYAVAEPATYIVTLDANGGSVSPGTTQVTFNSVYGDLPTPEKQGNGFVGWYTEAESGAQVTAETNVTETKNHKLYAHWTPYNYTVVYNANGGTGEMAPSEHTYGTASYLTANAFTKTGYNFAGWNTQADGKGTAYGAEAEITALTDEKNGKVTLYAIWGQGEIVVILDTNGGEELDHNSDKLKFDAPYGDLLTLVPTRTGYNFEGWYTEKTGGAQVTAEDIVENAESHTLYAHWSVIQYTASWNVPTGVTIEVTRTSSSIGGQGATGTLSSGATVYHGDVLGITYTASTGYTITSKGATSITVNGNVTSSQIYATAAVNEYTASWSAPTGATITVKRTSSPKKGAATGTLSSGATVYYGDVLSITYTASTGYTITSKGATSIEVTGNVTSSQIYATAAVNEYTASWSAPTGATITVKRTSSPKKGAATGTLSSGATVYYGDVLSITYTASTGYTIKDKGATSITVTGNVTSSQIYATAAVNEYTASWSAPTGATITVKRTSSPKKGAATGTLSSGATVYYGDVLSITYTASTGYTIKDKGATSITVTGNVTSSQIYATAAANTYTVTYNLNASTIWTAPSCSSTSKNVTYNNTYGTLATPSASYYTFDGWYTAVSGGTKITSSTTVSTASNHTLYAHWKQTDSDYTYIANKTQLSNIRNNPSGKYMLVADISSIGSWTPIPSFSGVFDGKNHTLFGLTIKKTGFSLASDTYYGLFGELESGSVVQNLTISNAEVLWNTTSQGDSHKGSGTLYVGLICGGGTGEIRNVNVNNSTIEVHRSRSSYGMIAGNFKGKIINCQVSGTGSSLYGNGDTGGIAGTCTGGTVESCTVTDLYIGYFATHKNKSIGGIVGFFNGGTIQKCSVKKTTFDYRGSDDGELDGESLHDFGIFGVHNNCALAPKMGYIVGHLKGCTFSENSSSDNTKGFYVRSSSTGYYGDYKDDDKNRISGNNTEGQYYFKKEGGKIGKLN